MTPDDIRRLVNSSGAATETAQRTASLQPVLGAVQALWLAGSTDTDQVAKILADASRNASWRIPIGESGLLGFFLGLLAADELRQPLKVHTLRLIGNACADEDANRARVVDGNHLARIVSYLEDDAILTYAIPVLYNICVDYEPAQRQACEARLSRALVSIVSGPRLAQCRALLGIVCKILGLLIAQEPEVSLADPATPTHLLQIATRPENALDGEEFGGLASVALAYLAYEPFQEALVQRAGVQALLTAFSDSYTKYDVAEMDPDDADEFLALGNRFTHVVADVAALLPSDPARYPLTSQEVQTLETWVRDSRGHVSLRTAGCIALGNLARSDASSIYFVHDAQIHVPLIRLLSQPKPDADDTPTTSHLLYAALSFLKNLAIPAVNKPILGVLLDSPASALPRAWTSTDSQPQVQFAAVSLARLLLTSCPDNVRRICSPSSPPSPESAALPARAHSNLQALLALFKRTDAENTKTEAARAVLAVCRVLHTSPSPESVLSADGEEETGQDESPVARSGSPPPSRRARLFQAHPDMADCFCYLMTQTRFPVLRSETWFVSALLSRSAEGANLVVRALQPPEACRALVEAVSEGQLPALAADANSNGSGSGKESGGIGIDGLGLEPQQVDPAQVASMARIDRENGLVLVAEILKNHAESLSAERRGVFEQLLQTGGALVVQARTTDTAATG